MHRKLVITADGSTTFYIEAWKEYYHSRYGALQESYHVFIKNGLELFPETGGEISVLEMGFGTGLNAFITWAEAEKHRLSVHYEGVEAYPLSAAEVAQLNYPDRVKAENGKTVFKAMHQLSWEETHRISPYFTLKKRQQFFSHIEDRSAFHLIYFDAFGARVQPRLWEEAMFLKMFTALRPGGILVTYAAKGSVRRAMQQVGFTVERLPGPPGKREMLRAVKP